MNEARVSAAIRQVLAKLPEDARDILADRWSWRLVDDLGKGDGDRPTWGMARYADRTVLIAAGAIKRLQEELLLQTLIAHELAHLTLYLMGRDDCHDERKVNDMVRRWKFPMDRLLEICGYTTGEGD